MKIISLGGIGGCDLAHALRDLNQPTYPYDWLVTTQTFIMDSFNNLNNFFIFDENYVYNKNNLITYNKKAVMLHDFNNFSLQKEEVTTKYKRRFERLNDALNSNEDILFVRMYDNLQEKLMPENYYNDIVIRDEEDLEKWGKFIDYVKTKYNKETKLLIITSSEDFCKNACKNTNDNIIIHFTKEHKNSKAIYKVIQNIINIIF